MIHDNIIHIINHVRNEKEQVPFFKEQLGKEEIPF